ncbi:MAG: Gfo/Idh/MocA family oxidoreductase [Candidatus Bathyarchaeota archaeon]|nr:Gfo/Idh/MocA family oxidoreductase [Candidatus Bathyarchaeota archaeon]
MTVKLGIIGLGFIGQTHLKHSLKLQDAQVIAAADVSTKALQNAKNMGVKKTFNNYVDLLKDPEVDAVLISLPTHLHLKCAIDTAEAHKNIFLEKPIAVSVNQARQIINAANQNSVKLMVGYPLRFNKTFLNLKSQLENGLIGDVENAHATYVSSGPFFHRAVGYSPVPVPEWWFNAAESGGGVLMDLGCHLINLLRWMLGEVVDVKGYFGHRLNLDFEDSALCLAKFNCGAVAMINVGWFSQEYALKLNMLGTVRNVFTEHMPPSSISGAYQMFTKGISSFLQPHLDELQYFVDCLKNNQSPSPSGEDALLDLEVISKAYKNRIQLE